jgi:hypothetical protein
MAAAEGSIIEAREKSTRVSMHLARRFRVISPIGVIFGQSKIFKECSAVA